ncbi:MAG: hypothetical protein CVV13_11025 [Gammaproteobacteria bacterium HGW-Gammaproteobacteria-3]|nr:MAG: hypothetical protein CVV13_11025 [Gammaproteobacteria bacterium HGW-Gammaproteobacteria-3]
MAGEQSAIFVSVALNLSYESDDFIATFMPRQRNERRALFLNRWGMNILDGYLHSVSALRIHRTKPHAKLILTERVNSRGWVKIAIFVPR